MLDLIFHGHNIGTVRDPDPRAIQSLIQSFTGQPQLKPVVPTQTLDDGGWAVIQWSEEDRNWKRIARLTPREIAC
jgi:hypothetical protein